MDATGFHANEVLKIGDEVGGVGGCISAEDAFDNPWKAAARSVNRAIELEGAILRGVGGCISAETTLKSWTAAGPVDRAIALEGAITTRRPRRDRRMLPA